MISKALGKEKEKKPSDNLGEGGVIVGEFQSGHEELVGRKSRILFPGRSASSVQNLGNS
jgi:hypothetical protein